MKDKEYIKHIITYCEKIQKYMEGMTSVEIFEKNELHIDAIMLNLEQIGETAKKLSDTEKGKYSSIDWSKVIGLRNIISHQYEGVDISIIYVIATTHIKQLSHSLYLKSI